ncbi:MAG: phosphatidylserine decarboxylase family protein [Ignavibacteria bacterium]|jgi:phosphatidylserine decarboxylase
MFTKYGYGTISLVILIVFIVIVISLFINNNLAKYILILLSVFVVIFTLNFFRDPDRNTPKRDNVIIAPADGKVISISKLVPEEFITENVNMLSIFMSPLDVHVNRIPVSGKIKYLNHKEGKFLKAFEGEAYIENERNLIGIENENGKVLFSQVAGAMARRIVCELNLDDTVQLGKRFGMIKFGSRSDIYAPLNWKPVVNIGDKVKAGETILFELTK